MGTAHSPGYPTYVILGWLASIGVRRAAVQATHGVLPTFTQMFAGRGKREVAQHQQQVACFDGRARLDGNLADLRVARNRRALDHRSASRPKSNKPFCSAKIGFFRGAVSFSFQRKVSYR